MAGDANVARYAGNGTTGAVDPSGLSGDDEGKGPTIWEIGEELGRTKRPGYWIVIGIIERGAGHASIGIVDTTSTMPAMHSISFGPIPGSHADTIDRVPGRYVGGDNRKVDFGKAFPITKGEHDKVLKDIQWRLNGPVPLYDLADHNCTHCVLEIANINVPKLALAPDADRRIGLVESQRGDRDDRRVRNYSPRTLEAKLKEAPGGIEFK